VIFETQYDLSIIAPVTIILQPVAICSKTLQEEKQMKLNGIKQAEKQEGK
jgi:hypothetical protein